MPGLAQPVERWLARIERRHHAHVADRRREEFEMRERDVAQRQILLRHLLAVMLAQQNADDRGAP